MEPVPSNSERLFADTQWLQRIARSLVSDPGAADDLVQDTWVAALRRRGDGLRDRRAWLKRLLVHRIARRYRGESARKAREATQARDEALPSSAELCERAELQRLLGEAMLALEEPYRTSVMLRFLEGLTPAEIAERQGLPANTVRWRLRQGIEAIRRRLERSQGKNWALSLLPFAEGGPVSVSGKSAVFAPLLLMKKAVVICAALVAVAWWGIEALRGVPSHGPRETTRPELVLDRGDGGAAHEFGEPERIVVELAGSETESSTATGPAQATVVFEVVAQETGRPLAGAVAMPEVRDHALVPHEEAKARRSNARGEIVYEVPAGEIVHVQAWGEKPLAGLAVLDVEPLGAGETKRVRVELPTAVDVSYFGRILDEESGEPLEAALVQAERPSGLELAIESATSGAQGHFELRVPAWRRTLFVIRAEGHGRVMFEPTRGHERLEQSQDIRLPGMARVEGRVADEGATHVRLKPRPEDVYRPRTERMSLILRMESVAEVGADGTYRLEGLNAGARYSAQLESDGELLRKHPGELVLAAGETFTLDWLERGARLYGTLLDEAGQAVPDAELWFLPTSFERNGRFSEFDRRNVRTSITDEDGDFEIAGVTPGFWFVGPSLDEHDLAPWGTSVQVARGTENQSVLLSTWRGLSIRGQVYDAEGRPAPGRSIRVVAEDEKTFFSKADETGAFVAHGLRPLEYTFDSGGMGSGDARSESVTARPGDTIEIRLRPGGGIRGRVLGLNGLQGRGLVLVSARDAVARGDEVDDWTNAGIRLDGYFSIDGLAPGLYDVVVARKDGRCGYVLGHEVRAGIAREELEIELGPGATLELGVASALRWASYELFRDGAYFAHGSCYAGETSSHVLPEGVVEVRFHDEAGHDHALQVTLHAGEASELILREP